MNPERLLSRGRYEIYRIFLTNFSALAFINKTYSEEILYLKLN